MKLRLLLLAASLAGLAASSIASAAIIDITYKGTVVSYAGPFGTGSTPDVHDDFGGGTLVGDPFSASFSFDTSLGQTTDYMGTTIIQGGSGAMAATPLIQSTLTIDGMTVNVGGFNDYIYLSPGASIGTTASDMPPGAGFQALSFGIDSTLVPATLTTPTSFVLSPTTTSDFFDGGAGRAAEYIYLSPTSATLTLGVSAAPEPAGWVLMILGCGLVGMALRNTRREVSTPAV